MMSIQWARRIAGAFSEGAEEHGEAYLDYLLHNTIGGEVTEQDSRFFNSRGSRGGAGSPPFRVGVEAGPLLLEECTTARENGFTPTMQGMQARILCNTTVYYTPKIRCEG